jgi:hypothetical protein
MLPGMFGAVGGLDATSSLREVIHALGLTSNLKVLLDAGDSASYDGSSQTWTDLSGGGYSFFRGSTSSSQSVDPTFSGTSGGRSSSEYFSLDGGDYFTLNQSNPSWVNDMHQSGATFTIAEWIRPGSISSTNYYGFLGDGTSASPTTGFAFGLNATDAGGGAGAIVGQINASSSSVWFKYSTATASGSAWNFLAISLNMSSGTVIFQINGTQESTSGQSFSGTPSTGSAAATLQIGATGSGTYPDNAERYGQVAIWSSALTAAQLSALFQATRGKYGI